MSVVKLTVQQGLEIHSLEIGRPSRYAVCAYGSNIFEVHGFVRGYVGISHAFYTDCFQILLEFYSDFTDLIESGFTVHIFYGTKNSIIRGYIFMGQPSFFH